MQTDRKAAAARPGNVIYNEERYCKLKTRNIILSALFLGGGGQKKLKKTEYLRKESPSQNIWSDMRGRAAAEEVK
jgi:hypothetical protein